MQSFGLGGKKRHAEEKSDEGAQEEEGNHPICGKQVVPFERNTIGARGAEGRGEGKIDSRSQ